MNNADTTSKANDTAASEAHQAVGQLLRETRKAAGFEIAEVARVLRISQRYLEALEDGRNKDLPGATYAIGFVRSYAEYLKLDGEEIVRRYKAEAQGVGVKNDLIFPKPIPDSGVPGAAVLGLGVIVAAVAYGVWYWNSNADDVAIVRVEAVPERMAAPEATQDASSMPQSEPAKVDDPVASSMAGSVSEPAKEAVAVAQALPEGAAESPAEPVAAAVESFEPPAAEQPADEPTVAEPPVPEGGVAEAPAPEEAVTEPPVEQAAAEAAAEPAAEPAVESAGSPANTVPTATVEVTSPAQQEPMPTPVPTAEEGAGRIIVRAKSNSWIQVRDEALDRLLFTRLLREGDEYEVPNRAGLRLMTGNAGALELLVDGEAIPAIGEIGEVRRNVELDPEKLKAGTAVSE